MKHTGVKYLFFKTMSLLLLILTLTSIDAILVLHSHAKSNETLTYSFSGYGVLINPKNYSVVWALLRYTDLLYYGYSFENTTLFVYIQDNLSKTLKEKLSLYEYIELRQDCGLSAGNSSLREVYTNDTLRILVPVGPCVSKEPWPIFLKVNGIVSVKKNDNETRVKVRMIVRMPLLDSVKGKVRLAKLVGIENGNGIFKLVDALLQGREAVLETSYIIKGNKTYQYNRVIGICPFYITYPINATQVKRVIENKIRIEYMDIPLSFYMINETVRKSKLGEPPKLTIVPMIVARVNYGFLENQLDIVTKKLFIFGRAIPLNTYIPYYKGADLFSPQIIERNEETLLEFIFRVLSGENVSLTYECCREDYMNNIYKIAVDIAVPLVISYRYHYPIRMNAPVLVSIPGTNTTIGIGLNVGFTYPKSIDPYSIDIGFYSPPQSMRQHCDCAQPIIMASIAGALVAITVIVYKKYRRKRT